MAEGGSYSQAEQREEEREEEEYIQIEEWSVNERRKNGAKCESCLRGDSSWLERSEREREERERLWRGERPWYDRVAVFMCFVCQIYVCADCMSKHKGHEGMKVRRKESERQEREESERMGEHSEKEGNTGKGKGLGKAAKRVRLEAESTREKMRREYINQVMNESEIERKEKFYSSHVVVCDRVEVRHELDQRDCCITGLCGLENKRWVVCDWFNHCIKIYKVGSNVLQRYIRLVGSGPWDVTEIHLKQNSAEPNLVSGSSSDISETGWADTGKQCLIAVTLPGKRQILFIDLNRNPAKTQKIIKTEKECSDIKFYDDKIFTVCEEDSLSDSPKFVYIYSTDGVTLHKFNADNYDVPRLAVVSGRVYLTDLFNNKVQCRNVKGQVVAEISIERSWPVGISVDPDNNVYVCAGEHNKVYKLNADLTRYKSVLDQTADYLENPYALCYYRDKLFISHYGWQPYLRNVVTVVRLL